MCDKKKGGEGIYIGLKYMDKDAKNGCPPGKKLFHKTQKEDICFVMCGYSKYFLKCL